MMMKKISVSLVLGTLYCFSCTVYSAVLEDIKRSGVLKICASPNYMPLIMVDKQDRIIGFDPDVAFLMAKELKVEPKFVVLPTAADRIPALLDNKCDIVISGLTINDERRQKIDFSNGYIAVGQTVLLRKGLADKIKSYKDLNDAKYKVVSVAGTSCEAAVKQYIATASYTPFKDRTEGVTAVLEGKADAFIYDSPYNAVMFGKYGSDKIAFLDDPFTVEYLGWGIRKDNPEFVDWLNTFLKKITSDGTKYKLYQKWFKNIDWLKDIKQ